MAHRQPSPRMNYVKQKPSSPHDSPLSSIHTTSSQSHQPINPSLPRGSMEPFGTTVRWAPKNERKCWKVSMSKFRFLVLRPRDLGVPKRCRQNDHPNTKFEGNSWGKDHVMNAKTHTKYRDASLMTPCTCKLEHFKHLWDYTHMQVPTCRVAMDKELGIKISHIRPLCLSLMYFVYLPSELAFPKLKFDHSTFKLHQKQSFVKQKEHRKRAGTFKWSNF